MAKEALKKVEEQLNCSICLDTYSDPKLLQCSHTYCRQCLVPLVDRDQQGRLGLTCPTCRQITPISDRGVAGLQPAFHINHLLEVRESLLTPEIPAATVGAVALDDTKPAQIRHCSAHGGKDLELYCETCGELICWRCMAKGGTHHDHDYEELGRAFKKYKEEIASSLGLMEQQVATIKNTLAKLDMRYKRVSRHQTTTKVDVHAAFGEVHEVLNDREAELIMQIDKLAQDELKSLAVQRDQIETTLAQLCGSLDFLRKGIWTGNEQDVLSMKTNTLVEVKELTTPFETDMLVLNTEFDLKFAVSPDVTAACRNYGRLVTQNLLPDISKCYVTGNGWESAVVGKNTTAILEMVDFDGKPCEEPIKFLECNIVSEITGTRGKSSIAKRGLCQYEISYLPTIKGRHQLHIKVKQSHIRGSPFSVTVKSSVENLGNPIQIKGGLVKPWGVAISQSREMVVTECGGSRVSVFSLSGERLRSFDSGEAGEQFLFSCGVAVDGEGNILVAHNGSHIIQQYTAEGRFLKAVGNRGSGPLQFFFPTGLMYNFSNKKVYVVDAGNYRVQVLNSDLTFFSAFGKKGSGRGQFNTPRGIACDSTGKVYVADGKNHRIQVFTAEGNFVTWFGKRGELAWPFGVAIDTSGMVYVSEQDNHRISVFSSGGQFVTSFGGKGSGIGEFKHPFGLAVDSGVLFVCDSDNNRVQLF